MGDDWTLYDDRVWIRIGKLESNNVAAFDLDGTLIWHASGYNPYPPIEGSDFVPVFGVNTISLIRELIDDNWTIVIFTNQRMINKKITEWIKNRIEYFIDMVGDIFDPFVYMSIMDDENRKPKGGMWKLFLSDTLIDPSPASFYCGDGAKGVSLNPLYQWSDADVGFAGAANLQFYTPEEMFESFQPIIDWSTIDVIFVMAAHEVQYKRYFNELDKSIRFTSLMTIKEKGDGIPVVIDERFATTPERQRVINYIDKKMRGIFFWFTIPIQPFLTDAENKRLRPQLNLYARDFELKNTPFPIVRIN